MNIFLSERHVYYDIIHDILVGTTTAYIFNQNLLPPHILDNAASIPDTYRNYVDQEIEETFWQIAFLKPEATIRMGNVEIYSALFRMVMRYVRGKKKGRLRQKGENMRWVLILEWGIFEWEEGGESLRNHNLLMVLDTPIQEIYIFLKNSIPVER